MFTVRHITSLDLPELQPYRTMRYQAQHREQGIFVAEGEKVVRRLLESRLKVISLLLPEEWLLELETQLEARPEQVQVFVAEKKLLETLTGYSMYQGLLAIAKIPPQRELSKILEGSSKPHLLVGVDGLANAENLGALVRNCAAFNVQALLVGETCCSPFLRRAVRSSMGTIFHLPIIEPDSLSAMIRELRRRGIRCIAAHPRRDQQTLSQADFLSDCCVIFGSEGHGLTPNVLEVCDESAAIPMAHHVDSLNVG